jgi:UDP-2-acetamido-3-amino-2,3-dideoxy-glucuronate N-acetyltransferase
MDAGLVLSPTATVGEGVTFGANVVVHDGVVIGDGVVVQDGAVLGKAPRPPRFHSTTPVTEALVIGDGAWVGAQAVVCAGARLERGTVIGDGAFVRERVVIGEDTVVGSHAIVDFEAVIGARVTVQSRVYLTATAVLEDDVYVGPGVTTTNDDTMARHPEGAALRGPVLRRACRIGGGAVLVPGVEIGEEAFVAAGAVVTNDVPSRAFVMGVPARRVRQVGDEDLLERWR